MVKPLKGFGMSVTMSIAGRWIIQPSYRHKHVVPLGIFGWRTGCGIRPDKIATYFA
jgi:hypothetical protein